MGRPLGSKNKPKIISPPAIDPVFVERDADPEAGPPPVRGPAPMTTPMQYRRHVVGWLQRARTFDEVAARWAADRALREACDVGLDDVKWLGTLASPILRDLQLQDGLKRTDVAGAWARHGVDEAPWRT